MDHKELYKKGIDLGEQQQRRQLQLLNEQKQRRSNLQDENRQIVEPDFSAEYEEDEKLTKKQQHYSRWQRVRRNKEQLQLQQSEWLRQRPDNLCDWLLVPCPVGRRCLVIACSGHTKVFNKSGRQIMKFRSQLPGDRYVHKLKTVLDCIYVAALDAFYVLDALSFGQQQLMECETSFRFYWLQARFEDHSELTQRSKHNEKPFLRLEYFDFENAVEIEAALQRFPYWPENKPQLDGLLFYHKDASYTCGTTPLVCWLFAFMLPDLLGLPVSSCYVTPCDYQASDALAYMDEFDKKLLAQRSELKKYGKVPKSVLAVDTMQHENDDDDAEDEDEENLKRILDEERRLELGEPCDMDCATVEKFM